MNVSFSERNSSADREHHQRHRQREAVHLRRDQPIRVLRHVVERAGRRRRRYASPKSRRPSARIASASGAATAVPTACMRTLKRALVKSGAISLRIRVLLGRRLEQIEGVGGVALVGGQRQLLAAATRRAGAGAARRAMLLTPVTCSRASIGLLEGRHALHVGQRGERRAVAARDHELERVRAGQVRIDEQRVAIAAAPSLFRKRTRSVLLSANGRKPRGSAR